MIGHRALPCRVGYVEGIEAGWLRGWAHDADAPGRSALLRVGAPGRPAVEVVADHYRADVQQAGFGDGFCGFALPMSDIVGGPIECRWADTGAPLSGSPWNPVHRASMAFSAGSLTGQLHWPVSGSGALTGFVFDRGHPGRRVSVVLVGHARTSPPALACRYDPQAGTSGTDGFHGFRLDGGGLKPIRRGEIRDAASGRRLLRLDRSWLRAAGLA